MKYCHQKTFLYLDLSSNQVFELSNFKSILSASTWNDYAF